MFIPLTTATITTLLTGVLEVITWFLALFADILNTITGTPLFLLPILSALAFLFIRKVVRFIKSFGVRGAK